jgi:ABC-type transport system involved in cytochrome c biogenesis permease component
MIPSPLWLSILTYFVCVGGLFLGAIGVAVYVGERRRSD